MARCWPRRASPASVDVFEAPYGGFCTTFSRSQDRFNLDALSAGLGSDWETMRVALKFYSCVGSNHTTLDAIRDIRKRRPFTLDELDRIVVHGSQVTADHVGWPYKPEGLTSAQLNLPYCVATLLIEGDVFVDQFTEEAVHDRARMELSKKVEVMRGPGHHGARRPFRHMVRVDVHSARRLRAQRDARGAARQRAFVRAGGGHRREIPQADPYRDAQGPAGSADRSLAESRNAQRRAGADPVAARVH